MMQNRGKKTAIITVDSPSEAELVSANNTDGSENYFFNFNNGQTVNPNFAEFNSSSEDVSSTGLSTNIEESDDDDEITFGDFDDGILNGLADPARSYSFTQSGSDPIIHAEPLAVVSPPSSDIDLSVPPSDDLLPDTPPSGKTARDQRLKVMEELVTSEQAYVASLRILCEIFTPALSTAPGVDAIVTNLFKNISHIYSLNRELLNELEQRLLSWEAQDSTVTDIFNEQMALFWFYSRFSVNLSAALEKIRSYKHQESLKKVIEDCERGREPLESLLIKPIQRIPRYILLLNDMARKSEPTDPDVQEIKATVAGLEKVADSLNESVREREGMDSLIKLQKMLGRKVNLVAPGRRILLDGMLWKVDRTGQPIKMHWHLFTDQLMFSRVSALATGGLYKHRFLALKYLRVEWDIGGYKFENAFTIKSPRKSFVVFSDTEIGARKWFNAINAACQAYADDNGLAVAPVRSPHALHECSACHVAFSMLHRRHHCRSCGAVVCSGCSNHRELLPAIDPNAKQRICDSCFEDMQDDKADDIPSPPSSPSKTKEMVSFWKNSMKKIISRHSTSSASSDQNSNLAKPTLPETPSSRGSVSRALLTSFRSRREVVEELLRTESAFLSEISITLDVIITPAVTQLSSNDSLKKISPRLIAAFEALEMIRTLSETVTADLEAVLNRDNPSSPKTSGRRISFPTTIQHSPAQAGAVASPKVPSSTDDPLVGDIFEKRANLFTLFGEYAEHLGPMCNEALHPDVESRIAALESDPRCGGMRFKRRLLIPLQRPSAYTFLLSKLIRLTPESHQDYQALQSAIENTTAASKLVSAAMKAGGQRAKINALEAQFHGKIKLADETELVRSGKVSLFDANWKFDVTETIPKFDQVTLHLFNDRLIVSHGDEKRGFKVDYDLVQSPDAWFEMDEEAARALSKALPLDEGTRYSIVRLHYGARNLFGLMLKEPAQKRSWVNDLQRCIHRSSAAIS